MGLRPNLKKNLIFILGYFVSILFGANVWGTGEDMHQCVLLPIIDSLGGNTQIDLFNEVEEYLKESTWCYYKSNSDMINIVAQYTKDLAAHLYSPEVLQTLSNKLGAGSMLRIKLDHTTNGVEMDFSILGNNGVDIYFHEKAQFETTIVSLLKARIVAWLEMFASTIPYDAQILGVTGSQIQIDAGSAFNVSVGDKVFIYRPLKKMRHPLLNEIVSWEKAEIGKGEIFTTNQHQSMAMIHEFKKGYTISKGDWVIIKAMEQPKVLFGEDAMEELKPKDFGRLGEINVSLFAARGESSTFINQERRILSGTQLGINGKIYLWATRNFFANVELEKAMASYKKVQGPLNQESLNLTKNIFKCVGGYKYLPLGYFYGPQIDSYIGYGRINYGFDTSVEDGFADVHFSGILLGLKGSLPLWEKLRINLGLEFLAFPKYEEEQVVLGKDVSVSSFQLQAGVIYAWNDRTNLIGSIQLESNKAMFNPNKTELSHGASTISVGIAQIF